VLIVTATAEGLLCQTYL